LTTIDSGLVVGVYKNSGTGSSGFLYNPNGATYTTISAGLGTSSTVARGINGSGLIVGNYVNRLWTRIGSN
jgi:hypothetical protein